VTDSTSDIPGELLKTHHLFQIPVDLTLENKTYLDGFDLSRNDFYIKLPTLQKLPTTGAPSVGRFQELYNKILDSGYSDIISIHAASTLSGIYNASKLASQEYPGRISVVDSQQISMGLGFQVLQAARDAQRGLEPEKILEGIQNLQNRIRVFALLDTLKYIHRSGRVSWAKAQIGSLLDIKPLIELINGEVINQGLARARQKGITSLGNVLLSIGPLLNLAVLHTNAEADGREFIKRYAPKDIPEPLLVNVTTIIGTHVGPNGLGFAAVVK
jgi:DegV family protein with EDD domain